MSDPGWWSPLHTSSSSSSSSSSEEAIRKAATASSAAESKQITDRMHVLQIVSKIAEMKKSQSELENKRREEALKQETERAKMWGHYTEGFIKNIYEPQRKMQVDQLNKELAARLKVPQENRQAVKDQVEIHRTFLQAAQLIADGVLTKPQAERMFEPGMPFANVRNIIRLPIQQRVFEFISADTRKRLSLVDESNRVQQTSGQSLRDDENIIREHEKRVAEVERIDMGKAGRYADWMLDRSGFPRSRATGGGVREMPSSSVGVPSGDRAKGPVTSFGGYLQNAETGETSFAPTYDATGAQSNVFERFNELGKGKKSPKFVGRQEALKYFNSKLSAEDQETIRGKTTGSTTSTSKGTSGSSPEIIKGIDDYLRSSI